MTLRDKAVMPHVAQHTSGRRSAIDDGTAGDPGYAISQRIRKRVEEAFGWAKTVRACARCGTADCSRSIGNSLSRWPLMTSSACPNCSPRVSDDPAGLSNRVPLRRRPPIRPTAKRARFPNIDHSGSQNALNSKIFQHPASAGIYLAQWRARAPAYAAPNDWVFGCESWSSARACSAAFTPGASQLQAMK